MTDEWKNRLGGSAGGIIGTLVFLWLFSPFGKSSDYYRADFFEKTVAKNFENNLNEESKKRKEAEIGWEKLKNEKVILEVEKGLISFQKELLKEEKEKAQILLNLVKGYAPKWRSDFDELEKKHEVEKKKWEKEREDLLKELKKLKGGKL